MSDIERPDEVEPQTSAAEVLPDSSSQERTRDAAEHAERKAREQEDDVEPQR